MRLSKRQLQIKFIQDYIQELKFRLILNSLNDKQVFQAQLINRKLYNNLSMEMYLCHFHTLLYTTAYLISFINDTY